MKKQHLYILMGLGLILIVGVNGLVWKNTSREPRESIQDQVIQQVSEQSQSAVQHEIDPKVRNWQTKETEFFSVRFPKEWFWVETSEPTPFFLGAIAAVDLELQGDLNISDLYKSGYKGILVLFTGVAPTSNLVANTDRPLPEVVGEFFHDWEVQQEGNKLCKRIDTTSDYVLECSGDSNDAIVTHDYFLVGSKNQLFFTIVNDADNLLDKNIVDAIAENVRTK